MEHANSGLSEDGSLWLSVRANPLDISLWLDLLQIYSQNHLEWQSIYVAKQINRLDSSLGEKIDSLLGSNLWRTPNAGDVVLGYDTCADAAQRCNIYLNWLCDNPADWLTWLYVVRLQDFLEATNEPDEAIKNAQRFEYIGGETLHLLGVWRLKAGDNQVAVDTLNQLVKSYPMRSGSAMYLGEALLRLGLVRAAEEMFSRASQSNHPGFLALLADTVYRHNYWQEAILVLKKSTEIVPEDVGLWLQLARIQSQVYHLEDCEESLLRAALAAGGEHAEVERLKIGLLGQYGDIKEYFDSLRRIYELNSPNNSTMLSGVLMASLYQDDWTPQAVADLHRSECRALVKKDDSALGSLKRDSTRSMLRVGYITGDLHRQHPVNLFMLPLLKQQQKQASMEVYVYHTGVMFDDYTQQARDCADRWVEASSMDDVSLHQRVLADQIDVLIDLAGHTSSNRLNVFARRAAPVQVTFLGYPHSTGLPNMDYIIGDSIVAPAEDAHLFSEKILRLDHSVFCWAPVDEYPILPKPEATMSVVFGSFNNAMKLSPKTIALWAAVLKAVPNARLMLKGAPFASEEVCERYRVRFADHGVNAERIDFRGPSELSVMMQEYADVDIALDPIVYNGGTTSLQALWMGVPLVTLKGGSFASRMGASFLATLGKNEWVAEDERSYVRIATKLAKNVNKIRESRYSLRREMEISPLSDIETYAQNFERILRNASELPS